MSDEPQEQKPQDIPPASAAPVETRRPRRAALKALIGLYALSLAAAGVLLLRPAKDAVKSEKPSIRLPKGLLSGAKKDYVGVVEIHGAIMSSDGGGGWSSRGGSGWARKLERLAKKSEVKAIVLSIDSPGGSVGSVQELHSLLLRLRSEHKKPIVAQLGDVAASGGYYLAVACDRIVAHPGTLVGSIGVIFNMTNVEGLMGKLGVKTSPIKSGKMKDIGSMSRAMTEEERALMQGLIDNAYGQFLGAVAEGRGKSPEAMRPHADGRIFTGEQAHKLGLIDELGDSWAAVQLAAKLAKMEGKPEVLKENETFSGIIELLESRLAFMRGPDLGFLSEMGVFSPGLEYRWRP
ncbi:MAG: signal peptide peptidase SppA [Elusimicrobia bacterium]|nr:signal peptide peptidase SppA [Elusimicrobiota bacterium]